MLMTVVTHDCALCHSVCVNFYGIHFFSLLVYSYNIVVKVLIVALFSIIIIIHDCINY